MTGFEPAASWSQTRRSSQAEPHPVASALFCSRTTLDYYIKNILFCQQGFSNLFVSNIEHERERSSGRLYRSPIDRRRDHLHRKTHILPCEPKNATAFLVSQSDMQCFSHEDDPCAGYVLQEQPVWTAATIESTLLTDSNQMTLSSPNQYSKQWCPHNYRFNLYQDSLFPY